MMFDSRNRQAVFLKVFFTSLFTSLVVGAILFILLSGAFSGNLPQKQAPGIVGEAPKPQQITLDIETRGTAVSEAVAKSATPGVVGISVLRPGRESIFRKDGYQEWGVGSGVIVSSNGYILTNHHVAGGRSERIIVSLADGRNVDGITKWSDPVLDLAVVKVNLEGLPTIPLGDSSKLSVGEPAIAIGNPLGLQFQRTVTSGIISALNRTIQIETEEGINYMEDLIQTDASINPGNSGGPLLNAKGEVIGINTIKVTSAEAMGFAIPINVTIPIIKRFIKDGEFREPYLGIFAYDREVAPFVDGKLSQLKQGIYVAHIDENGPAYKSGIRLGCVMTHVDGRPVNTMMQLREILYSKKPGDTIKVTHVSNGKTNEVTIKLGKKDGTIRLTR